MNTSQTHPKNRSKGGRKKKYKAVLDILGRKIKQIPFNKLDPTAKKVWLDQLVILACKGRDDLGKEFNIVGDIGEIAVAIRHNLRLYPDKYPYADGVEMRRGPDEYSIKTIAPSTVAATGISKISMKIDMNGKWGVLAWVILDNDFTPLEILTAKKRDLKKALLSSKSAGQRGGPTPKLHGDQKIEYRLMKRLQPSIPASNPSSGPLP